ncbi:MAG: 5-formyltetrahydrofolate cyclo-ligase [Eudoraea sp.]|nr:5-formyltetrahydrofolate cyclo-ligase [Eudoraea sp.]
MLKKELRTKYLDLRNTASEEDVYNASITIANNLLALPIWDYTYYHIFLHSTSKKELNTSLIITLLQGKDKEIVVPRMAKENTLQHFLLTDNTLLKPNSWDIPEPVDGIEVMPAKLDVIFVPLLTFDLKGHRVGYGKGYYDLFLSQCKPNAVKIGLSMFGPEENIADVGPQDIPLDHCVSPATTYTF